MGQKVNPTLYRTGYLYGWRSTWVAKNQSDFKNFLKQDVMIRRFLKTKLKEGGVASVDIERTANVLNITIQTSRPGVVIGRGGKGIEDFKSDIVKMIKKFEAGLVQNGKDGEKEEGKKNNAKPNIQLTVKEVREPYLSAEIVKQMIIADIEKRVPFRRAAKQAIQQVEKAGAKGVKIILAGRLDGAEIARTEAFTKGKIPLQTLRADIDYSCGAAHTIYGTSGVKVWIYRGDVFKKLAEKEEKKIA